MNKMTRINEAVKKTVNYVESVAKANKQSIQLNTESLEKYLTAALKEHSTFLDELGDSLIYDKTFIEILLDKEEFELVDYKALEPVDVITGMGLFYSICPSCIMADLIEKYFTRCNVDTRWSMAYIEGAVDWAPEIEHPTEWEIDMFLDLGNMWEVKLGTMFNFTIA